MHFHCKDGDHFEDLDFLIFNFNDWNFDDLNFKKLKNLKN